jgi:hypothetical protein
MIYDYLGYLFNVLIFFTMCDCLSYWSHKDIRKDKLRHLSKNFCLFWKWLLLLFTWFFPSKSRTIYGIIINLLNLFLYRSPPRPPLTSSSSSSSPSSTNSAKPSRRKTAKSSQGTSDRKRKNSSNNLTSIYDQGLEPQALAELYARLEKNSADILLLPKPTRSTSIDTVWFQFYCESQPNEN